jgi:hypothetical protein
LHVAEKVHWDIILKDRWKIIINYTSFHCCVIFFIHFVFNAGNQPKPKKVVSHISVQSEALCLLRQFFLFILFDCNLLTHIWFLSEVHACNGARFPLATTIIFNFRMVFNVVIIMLNPENKEEKCMKSSERVSLEIWVLCIENKSLFFDHKKILKGKC